MWYIYTMEYYSAIKNNDFMKFVGKWLELENIILSELTQTQKDIHGNDTGNEDAIGGNVNKYIVLPTGYSGQPKRGHLTFDACFESELLHSSAVIYLNMQLYVYCFGSICERISEFWEHVFHYVPSGLICDSQKLETTQMSPTGGWVQKMWFIYTMEYYLAIKNYDILSFAGKFEELENILNENITIGFGYPPKLDGEALMMMRHHDDDETHPTGNLKHGEFKIV
uniref:LRRGT00089 n=1 Tax=Rattus norvegicus TaxID=10116 RepID=Q6TUF5_RAT|nr:LRRGT00089 [Rattus norvegicus]|eukprot:NP_001094451.1 cytosolic carboxypeptidase 6 [Rattus norvegicus]